MKFLILDGNSILNRAFYGISMLCNKKGQMTNAIYGFLSTLQKLLSEVCPDAVAVAFDLPIPTFRHKMYENYKAGRRKMPDELASQIPILKDLLNSLGYKLVSCEGYEADDILGTFANYCESKGYDCVLATGDKDTLQLISERVTVRIASTKYGKAEATFFDLDKIKEIYGVKPNALVDIKALQGDISDNIPGVRGIGEKTAKELIIKFGSIENIYKNIDFLDIKESLKNKLKNGKDSAFMSYKLGEINKNTPIDIDDKEYIVRSVDKIKAKQILTELEFFSFIEKLGLTDDNYEKERLVVELTEDTSELLEKIKHQKFVSFSIDAVGSGVNKIFIKIESTVYIVGDLVLEFLKQFFEINGVLKVTYDIKRIIPILKGYGDKLIDSAFDIMLASYLLNPSSKDYELSRLSKEYSIASVDIVENFNLSNNDINNVENVYCFEKLFSVLKRELEERNQYILLKNIEQPLAQVLADMESIGFGIDKDGLVKYGENVEIQLNMIKKSIHDMVGFEFNINSPKQLGSVLFDNLGLPRGKKGKTGYSTSAETLEKLRGYHEIVDAILEYRALAKLKSTYCDGMVKLITPMGRIHSFFNQTETRTGRISSAEPNLQNIPVRTERGRELRKFFRASEGRILIDADYSQIELRVLAHLSNDEAMINAFKNDEDIHSITASQILNIPIEMITPEMRFRAKAINFGIIYGMGAFSLAQDIKTSRYEAQNYIDRYLSHYKGVDEYMHRTIQIAKKCGYSETILHRRRYLPELESTNHTLRNFGERVARNMPIQGTAADIIKIAMINTYKHLKNKNLRSKIVLQVHDELIIETPIDEAEKVKSILQYEMENAMELKVPLKVNISVGKTWFDAKD